MTPAAIFHAIDVALDIIGGALGFIPGADIADDILDAVSDALPEIETLATTPGWDADDVAAVRNILVRALSEIPRLPTADVLSHADSFARLISRAVSAGLKQEAPALRGRGRRRRETLRDVGDHVATAPHIGAHGLTTTFIDSGKLDPDRKPALQRVDR